MSGRQTSILWLRDHPRGPLVWGSLALVSVAVGAFTALQPARSGDFETMRLWLQLWTEHGADIYAEAWLEVDHPPHALVLLWPLHLLPERAAIPLFLILNIAATAWMAWTVSDWLADATGTSDSQRRRRLVFALMILSFGAVRVSLWNGQTVPIAIGAGFLALRWAASRPWFAAVALAVAATKPTLGVAFGLALSFSGGYRVLAGGAIVTGVLTMVYARSVGATFVHTVWTYYESVERVYTGENFVRGVTSLHAAFIDPFNGHPNGHVAFGVYGAVALAALVVIGWRARRHPDARVLLPIACLFWTLVALSNQRYYLMLTAPAIWLLVWTPQLVASPVASWPRYAALAAIVFNVIDGPLALRKVAEEAQAFVPFSLDPVWWTAYVIAAPFILAFYVVLLVRMARTPVIALPRISRSSPTSRDR